MNGLVVRRTTLASLLWCLALGLAADESRVYRCIAPDGRVEFRQFPCHGRDTSDLLQLDDRPSGWVPPKPSEVFDRRPDDKSRARSTASSNASREAAADRRREEKCWNKEHQLEQVNRKLRKGYRAGEGESLRQKRREHQDYLRRFCD